MQDRLAELRRQRALVAEHLAWLDREIASVPSAAPVDPAPLVAKAVPESIPAAPPPVLVTGIDSTAAEALPLPETKPAEIKDDVRRGCFLYFALACFSATAVIGLLVWASQAYKKSHPPKPHVQQVEQP